MDQRDFSKRVLGSLAVTAVGIVILVIGALTNTVLTYLGLLLLILAWIYRYPVIMWQRYRKPRQER